MPISDKPKYSKGELRRIAVLDVAEKLFLSKGFSNVTLDTIIAEAGGSRRVIYEHFGDKTGLFQAVFERIVRRVDAELEGVHDIDSEPRESLCRLGENLLKVLTSYPTLPLFALALAESQRVPVIGQMFYQAVPQKAYSVLADYLDRQIALGIFRPVDTAVATRQFLGMIREDVHLRCVLQPDYRPSEGDIKKVVAGAVDMLLRAMAPQ